jgi:hypothetical protein
MKANQFSKLLAFLERLDKAKVPYDMRHSREDAIMVVAFAPGQYWEIDFLEDGEIEIERFTSNGHIDDDESILNDLFLLWAEDETATEVPVDQNDAIARK